MENYANKAERIHFFDAARAIYMIMGIPYHVALMFVPAAGWLYFIQDGGLIINFFAALSHSFRMASFFLVAGFFAGLLLQRKSTIVWLKSRLVRIGIPLVFSILIISPIQMVIVAYATAAGEASVTPTVSRLLTSPGFHWIEHLWFLPVLILCSILISLVWMFDMNKALGRVADKISVSPLLPIYLFIFCASIAVGERFISTVILSIEDHFLVAASLKVARYVALYFPYFLIGATLALSRDLMVRYTHFSPMFLVLGLASFALYLPIWQTTDPTMLYVRTIAVSGTAIGFSQLTLCLFRTFLNKPSRQVTTFVDYSFSIYLVHHPLVVLFGVIFGALNVSSGMMFAMITLSVLVVSYLVAMVIDQFALSRFVFNGLTKAPLRSR